MAADELVVRLPNWIGDCVMAQPALHALHRRGLRFTAWGRSWAPTLLAAAPYAVCALPDERRAHARRWRATGASHALLLTHSLSTALDARRAGLPAIGYQRDVRGPLLRHRLRWPQGVHEVRRYWLLAEATRRLLAPASAPLIDLPPACRLELPPEARAALPATATPPQVLVCPVATGTVGGRSKHYPDFPTVAARLAAQGIEVAVLAPPGARAAVAAGFPGLRVIADLSFAGFMALLADTSCVLCNDSGPMHVAAALGTPVVVPFGITRARWTGAWSRCLEAVEVAAPWPPPEAVVARVRAVV